MARALREKVRKEAGFQDPTKPSEKKTKNTIIQPGVLSSEQCSEEDLIYDRSVMRTTLIEDYGLVCEKAGLRSKWAHSKTFQPNNMIIAGQFTTLSTCWVCCLEVTSLVGYRIGLEGEQPLINKKSKIFRKRLDWSIIFGFHQDEVFDDINSYSFSEWVSWVSSYCCVIKSSVQHIRAFCTGPLGLHLYALLRFITGVGAIGSFMVCFVLAVEHVGFKVTKTYSI